MISKAVSLCPATVRSRHCYSSEMFLKYPMFKRITFIIPAFFLCLSGSWGQPIADSVYWVYFTDKNNNGYRTDQPLEFLTQRSVDRRAWQGLGIDDTDLPVTRSYVDEIRSMGIQVRHVSRWLNGVAIVNASAGQFEAVLSKDFTDTVPWQPDPGPAWFPPAPAGNRFAEPLDAAPEFQYGVAEEQVSQVRTDFLHELGYTGKGVWIGVLDAGFYNVDSLPAFASMIEEDRLLGMKNYVDQTQVFRNTSTHGMYVLSIIGGLWNGFMVGTAPHASYLLLMTEDTRQETRIEEIAWIEAAEYADSLGVDVFNTSLGYADFDGTAYDYIYREMDGKTAFISRAASMTASKGIISCHSAGNQGNNEWYYITAPADAFNILTVGAVDSTNLIAGFSSRGPTFDGRIKPEVVAMGSATGVQTASGGLGRGGGTSFSSPVIAGSVASLWQAYPDLSATEMIYMIRNSGDRSKTPGVTYGYGLPDFTMAYWQINRVPSGSVPGKLGIYPNPASTLVMVKLPGEEPGTYPLVLYDMSGRAVYSDRIFLPGELALPPELSRGMYIIEVKTRRNIYRDRLIRD
jgi:serine protease AprX